MITKRIKECDECGGVLKSVWHDGKTRSHELRCLNCDNETTDHESNLRYIEARRFDPFEVLTDGLQFEEWYEQYEEKKANETNKAFRAGLDRLGSGLWPAVMVRRHKTGSYSVSVYDVDTDENPEPPFGSAEVSWSVDRVVFGDSGFMLPEGGWAVFELAKVDIEYPATRDEYVRVH